MSSALSARYGSYRILPLLLTLLVQGVHGEATSGFSVDTSNRTETLAFHQRYYMASENYAANMNWTGSVAGGVAGTTSSTFKDDVLRRINYYRALSGQPADIYFNATKSAKCQKAALMFAANGQLSHNPPTNWTYYTADGAEAAGASNIALGNYGPAAVDAFMEDDGASNAPVGHRRWLLYSRAQEMGTGDVPTENPYWSANAIWVIGNNKPAPPKQFVGFPNAGYFPDSLRPGRWSLSYPGANFSSASVTMSCGGVGVPITIVSSSSTGMGDNTIVWQPGGGIPAAGPSDVLCDITVSGISGTGVPTSHSYTVKLFNPDVLTEEVLVSGSATPPTTGADYSFNQISAADAYELRVSQELPGTWVSGAEDPSDEIIAETTGSYPLRQTSLKRTGSKAFQLVLPDWNNQKFIVAREIIPTATSQLQFYERCRYATTVNTLDAEISADGGGTWTSVWTRNGVGNSSAFWDANWNARSISLAAYAGQTIQVRFHFRYNGTSFVGSTSSSYGFFIDDISVTNSTELVPKKTTALASSANSFTLNATTAGESLSDGASYVLQIRPQVGTKWFGYGPQTKVTISPLSGYELWASNHSIGGTGSDDSDLDGIRNLVEYAFDTDPGVATSQSLLPQATRNGNNLEFSYTPPSGRDDVIYGAEWSNNLADWFSISNSGSGGAKKFSVSTTGKPKLFMRHRISQQP